MEKRYLSMASAVFVGLLIGVAASAMTQQKQSRCDRTEESLRKKANVSGALACFPPGVIEVNLTDRVEQGADLRCVCRQSIEGKVQIFAINRANPLN